MKRVFCAVLIICVLFTIGCKRAGDDESLLKSELTGVYRSTVVEIPDEYYIDIFTAPTFSDGMYRTVVLKDGYVQQAQTVTFDTDGGNLVLVDDTESGSEHEAVNDGAFVVDAFALDDKLSACSESYYTEVEMRLYLTIRSGDDVLFSVEVPPAFCYDMNRDLDNLMSGEIFRIMNVISAMNGDERIFVVLTSEGICAFDDSGDLLWVNDKQRNPTAVVSTDAGVIYLYGEDQKQSLKLVKLADGSIGESVTLPDSLGGLVSDTPYYFTGPGYDLYVKNRLALWGVTLEKGADGGIECVPTEIINWLNSDISPSEIYRICAADETCRSFAVTTSAWRDTALKSATSATADIALPKNLRRRWRSSMMQRSFPPWHRGSAQRSIPSFPMSKRR